LPLTIDMEKIDHALLCPVSPVPRDSIASLNGGDNRADLARCFVE
jgi:hypothetical protein